MTYTLYMSLLEAIRSLSHKERYELLQLLSEKSPVKVVPGTTGVMAPWERAICAKCSGDLTCSIDMVAPTYKCKTCDTTKTAAAMAAAAVTAARRNKGDIDDMDFVLDTLIYH